MQKKVVRISVYFCALIIYCNYLRFEFPQLLWYLTARLHYTAREEETWCYFHSFFPSLGSEEPPCPNISPTLSNLSDSGGTLWRRQWAFLAFANNSRKVGSVHLPLELSAQCTELGAFWSSASPCGFRPAFFDMVSSADADPLSSSGLDTGLSSVLLVETSWP